MRSICIQALLAASSVVAVAQQQRNEEHEENVLSARQAFREIHDHLLGLQLPGEVSQLELGGNDQGLLQASSRVNTTGWDELVREEDELTGSKKGNVKEDPEDRPRGRFLHITDFHPDPFYTAGSTFESGCHRKPEKKKKKKGKKGGKNEVDGLKKDKDDDEDEDEELAGRWGTSSSDCDAPMSLVNMTFDWLKQEWADKVDFVVWTGDNARHDIDSSIPRTPSEINDLNRMMVRRMRETFGEDVVVVPSLGNNDIYPHNILVAGPNAVTNSFTDIWSDYIPAEDYHVFQRGAYFAIDVIPDKLAVISLNTLYWYDANKVVDGCKDGSNEPGALEFDWLEVQLDSFRERGMQVWLTGHVPPKMGRYFDNCYLRYGELALRYQDTIVGHLYGHMNVDHFFFLDVDELEATTPLRLQSQAQGLADRVHAMGRIADTNLQQELHKDFNDMPKLSKIKMEDYAVVHVSPSVIPTYLPGIRVFSYNVTGLELDDDDYESGVDGLKKKGKKRKGGGHRHGKKPKNNCHEPEHEDQPHCKFRSKPRFYSPESPSRSNQMFTPLGYAQFYVPDLDKQTVEPPKWELEYATYDVDGLLRGGYNGTDGDATGRQPVPWHLLPGFDEVNTEVLARAQKDGEKDPKNDGGMSKFRKGLKKLTPFRMSDLTIPTYVALAKQLSEETPLWNKFARFMYVSTKTDS
ncbi:hypothetical protein FFLO_06927 [Filobasidium floriforme]|uniref:Endopolyphosphatase n=1 Tax=Filobasidium floriforme TaxID=5210 RepID=A0A8K0JFX5_9TREE|nr:putative endopolyphosphatase [Filobasidium floriforme]KAG7527447.1 hypothetical protein FFLO_06927 [Filobasidium floriforme]KAH8082778.1 putative endopolyphosphatase [Filobasidium floriforme]